MNSPEAKTDIRTQPRPRRYWLIVFSCMAALSLVPNSQAAPPPPTASTYVGFVARLEGGSAWMRTPDTNGVIRLEPKNARGRLIYSDTELSCEPQAQLWIQLRWGGVLTNLSWY